MPRGGKRKGAGRPKGRITPESKVIRVRSDLAQFVAGGGLEELLSVIEDWRQQIEDASPTSPRWQQARMMMNEIQEVIKNID